MNPLDALKRANQRMKSSSIETPLDFLRIRNKEVAVREQRREILKRVKIK